MIKLLAAAVLILILPVQGYAISLEPPPVPPSGASQMPQNTQSFSEGLMELLNNALGLIRPDLAEAARVSLGILASVMLISLLHSTSDGIKQVLNLTGTAAISAVLLLNTRSMIRLGAKTVQDLTSYGKLLFPVMTSAMAAQGGVTSSAALYAGTSLFGTVLSSLICQFLLPMVYLFLALAAGNSATGDDLLKRTRDLLKTVISWCLKTLLTVFTTYMGITGVVSGTTDAAALKATKVTISSVVPVVGGILSDASEAVLVSAGVMKNAAGIYGILAVLAVFLEPFIRIGIHYLVLKITAAACGIFGSKSVTALVDDFSSAMGLILAMTGSACLFVLISTVCFLKGVG